MVEVLIFNSAITQKMWENPVSFQNVIHFLIFLPGTSKSVELSPLSRIHGLRSLDHQKKRMQSFVRGCRRSASLVAQRLLGIRLSHMQRVARLLSQDQQNNLVEMDGLLMNCHGQQSHLQLGYHICSHLHWPLCVCQNQEFHFKDTMSHRQKRCQRNLGLTGWSWVEQEGYILFNPLVPNLPSHVKCKQWCPTRKSKGFSDEA